jgi:hypothetical protein
MPMKNKLASIIVYLMTAGYFFASLYILIYTGSDDNIGWFNTFHQAWITPEYEEVFEIAIASICVNLFVAFAFFFFIGRSKTTDYLLTVLAWCLAVTGWCFTPGLAINYVLGAIVVSSISAQHLTSLGKGRS